MKTIDEIMFDCKLQEKRETKFTQEHEYELRQDVIEDIKKLQKEIENEKEKAIKHYQDMSEDFKLGTLGEFWTKQTIIKEIKEDRKRADHFLEMGLQSFTEEGGKFVDTTNIKTFDNRAKIEYIKKKNNLTEKDLK